MSHRKDRERAGTFVMRGGKRVPVETRNKEVDTYIEQRFGKPDFSRSFVKDDVILTPMGAEYKLWREERRQNGELKIRKA